MTWRRIRFVASLPALTLVMATYLMLRSLSWVGWKAGNAEDWMDRNLRVGGWVGVRIASRSGRDTKAGVK